MNIEAREIHDALKAGAQRIVAAGGYSSLKLVDILEAAGLSPDLLNETPDAKRELAYRLAMLVFEQMRENSLGKGDAVEMLDRYLTDSMRIIIGGNLEFVQLWIGELVNDNYAYGVEKMRWDWQCIAGIIRTAIDAGELREDTPVGRLTGLLMAQYYGTLFAWCVLQGSMDAIKDLHRYVTEEVPRLLKPYRNAGSEIVQ